MERNAQGRYGVRKSMPAVPKDQPSAANDSGNTLRYHRDVHAHGRICIDSIGPLPRSGEGYIHILVILDSFTRWVELIPLKTVNAEDAAEELIRYIGRYGAPKEMLSDRGSQFVNGIIQSILRKVGTEHLLAIAYSKEENGRVERANKEVLRHLKGFAFHEKMADNWHEKLPFVMRIMNSGVHSVTGYAPSRLLYGMALDLNRNILPNHNEEPTKPQISLDPNDLHEWVIARDRDQAVVLEVAKEIQEKLDAEHIGKGNLETITIFPDDSLVLIQPPDNALTGRRRHSKLDTYWKGPMKVMCHIGNTYYLQDLVHPDKHIQRNVKELKAYIEGDELVPTEVAQADYREFVVEAIRKHEPGVGQGTRKRMTRGSPTKT